MHRLTRTSVTAPAVVLLAALALSACGKGDDAGIAAEPDETTEQTASAPAPVATTATPPEPESRTNAAGCEAVPAPEPKGEQSREAPELELDEERTYTATLDTTCGDVKIRLDVDDSPKTAASFVSLARSGFYDDLTFHRIARPGGTPFVVQGGDPQGTGNGGPGYSVTEAPPGDTEYRRGTVAMAKTEIEDPGTSGSQFFIVTADDAGLPADYAVLGRVVDGMDAVEKIGNSPTDPATEMPTEPMVIKDVEVEDGAA